MMERISDIEKTRDEASLHILVVEDNLDSQVLVCELLNVLGHRADGVASGEYALSALEKDAYDVLFTDISLPGMSGIELVRKVSETNPALKIIYASGYGAQVRKNVDSNTFSLPKPYDIDELQNILDCIHRQLQAVSARADVLTH